MVLNAVKSSFKKNEAELSDEAFVPSLKTLTALKQNVPYLKDFHFKKTSVRAGDAKSAFKGRGIEFEEVRPYQFGDDVRDIDWRVTARKNQPFTKLYMEEKDRQVFVFLDLSSKMYFGTKTELKSVCAAKIAALLGWLALSYHDKLGLAIYTGTQTYFFEARHGETYFLSVLKKIEDVARQNLSLTADTQTFSQALKQFEAKIFRSSVIFLVSSFDTDDAAVKSVQTLTNQNEVYVIDVFDPLENDAPPKGVYPASYHGQNVLLTSDGKSFEQTYKNYFAHKRKLLEDFCARYGAQYRPVQTDLPIYTQLKPV